MMVFEIPATVCRPADGKASDNRDKSEDLPKKSNIQGFREKKQRVIRLIPPLIPPERLLLELEFTN